MSDRPTILLEHHLKELRLPTFLREYDRMAAECAEDGVGHPDYLLRPAASRRARSAPCDRPK